MPYEQINCAETRMDAGFHGAKFAPLFLAPFAPLLFDDFQFLLFRGYTAQCMSLDGRAIEWLALSAVDAFSAELLSNPVCNVCLRRV